jgi:hypothetical protein
MQNFDHNIGCWEKRQFFRRKLSKIAENCDHNIDPRYDTLYVEIVCFEEDRQLLQISTFWHSANWTPAKKSRRIFGDSVVTPVELASAVEIMLLINFQIMMYIFHFYFFQNKRLTFYFFPDYEVETLLIILFPDYEVESLLIILFTDYNI